MISFILLSIFVFVSGAEQEAGTPAPGDVAQRVLTNAGYLIRYGHSLYRYPGPLKIVPPAERNPTETNEIGNKEDDERRPLFFFTSYEPEERSPREPLPDSRPYIEIRRKRDVDDAAVPESSKIGKLRRKRTYCGKCGRGGGRGGGYYVPVAYAVYPVSYGGGGKGCNTCGGGGGFGGGGGGSYSYSQSSASSSSGSYGWGKK